VLKFLSDPSTRAELTRDPTSLLPETLLVFTVSGEIQNLANALKKIPGLDLVGEDLDEAIEDAVPESGDNFLYLMLPSQSALAEIERLWRRWAEGDTFPGSAPIRDLFECLKSIRRWSAQDRISDADARVLMAISSETPTAQIAVEIELVFRESTVQAEIAREAVRAAVRAAGGRVLHEARHGEFVSDALLVELPAREVNAIANHSEDSLAALEPIMTIGPQASISLRTEVAGGDVANVPGEMPDREPIAALLDAVPSLDHELLSDRMHVDDPAGLDARAVGLRVHGTAMASLIIHGDLNELEPPVSRPLYVRPVMYARTQGDDDEVFPNDRLLVDDFYDAVVRMKKGLAGEPASAPSVLVVNVSLGDNRRRFAGRMSRWARAIDDLAWRYGILFVISAGNLDIEGLDDVALEGFADAQTFAAASANDREVAVVEGIAASIRNRSLLAPADSINALTVGAVNRDMAAADARGRVGLAPYTVAGSMPNPSSAPGLGYGRSIKPDILMSGGQELILPTGGVAGVSIRPVRIEKPFGLKAAQPRFSRTDSGARVGFVGQTSTAAALATRTAHRLHDVLEIAYGSAFLAIPSRQRALLLKALLVHRARWTTMVSKIDAAFGTGLNWQKRRANATRMLGYGVVKHEDVLYCVTNRATAWAVGEVKKLGAAIVTLPLPASLSGKAVAKSIAVTLAWFSPTAPGRRSYKTTRLILADPHGDDLGRLGLDKHDMQPDVNATRRGTVAHRVFKGDKAAAFVANDKIEFRVQRERDSGVGADDTISFAVAITIETEADLPIYQEVSISLPIKPAVAVVAATTA
jgi:hypothetical protein